MSEFSLTTANEKTQDLSSLLLSDFMLFCSLILSHPLYFSYFIFFSPYFLKIFSFLSPLFITTTLLLLAFLTLTSPTFVNHGGVCHLENSLESKESFLLTAYQTFVETLRSKVVDYDQSHGFGCLEELEAFKIVFETTTIVEIKENQDGVLEMESKEDFFQAVEEAPVEKKCPSGVPEDEQPPEIKRTETNQVKAVVKIFDDFVVKKENLSLKKRDKEVKSVGVESNKVGERKEDEIMAKGSEAVGNKISDLKVTIVAENGSEHAAKAMVNANNYNEQTMGSDLWSLGSMRKQKEWNRTLACKLFEERHSHNVDGGGEGMDLLWETYETDSDSKVDMKSSSKKGKKGVANNNGYYYDNDDYEEDSNVQLCCLQALKFSAGKMNLGMGRPNLVKISKALKGIGWLHRVGSRKGKKGYH